MHTTRPRTFWSRRLLIRSGDTSKSSVSSARSAIAFIPCFAAHGAITITLAGDGTTPFPTVAIPANPCALTGSTNAASGAFNSSRTGGGIGANGRVSFGKHLDVGIHFLGGDGIGRYGTAGLPDSTARPDGTMALIRSYQALGSLVFHATPKLLIFTPTSAVNTRAVRWTARKVTGAIFAAMTVARLKPCRSPRPQRPSIRPPFWAPMVSFLARYRIAMATPGTSLKAPSASGTAFTTVRRAASSSGSAVLLRPTNTWSGVNATGDGVGPHAIDNMVFTSVRYYLP